MARSSFISRRTMLALLLLNVAVLSSAGDSSKSSKSPSYTPPDCLGKGKGKGKGIGKGSSKSSKSPSYIPGDKSTKSPSYIPCDKSSKSPSYIPHDHPPSHHGHHPPSGPQTTTPTSTPTTTPTITPTSTPTTTPTTTPTSTPISAQTTPPGVIEICPPEDSDGIDRGAGETGNFSYELMTLTSVNTEEALNNIQETLANEIGSLFTCDNPNRKLTSITGIIPLSESKSAPIKEMHRKLQSSTSVDLGPHTIDTNTNCAELKPRDDTQKCEVISASITVYTSDPDLLSNALNLTENGMNVDKTFVNETLGILDLYFLVASPQIVTAKAISPVSSSTLSEPAIAGVVTGSVLILVVAFLLTRSKKSVTRRNVSEDFEDDDLSLFSKSDDLKNLYPEGPFSDEDLDGVSNRNRFGRGRRARVLNEDDYDLSSPYGMESIAAVDTPEDEGFECQRQTELDVHKCSSATCQLCIKRRNTVFEPSFGNHSGSRIYHNENTVTF